MVLNYKNSGVDIEKGNSFVNIIKDICVNNKNIGGYSGIYELDCGIKLVASTDGVGSKLEICKRFSKYDTIGIDLVAMCVNDLICQGGKPLFFLDYYAMGKLDLEKGKDIIKGINDGCKESDCILLGGETAEMPRLYKDGGFDLAGFSVGIIENDIYPKEIVEGDLIFGLKSNGLHSNGYSLVNTLLETIEFDKNELIKPTKIYVKDVEKLKIQFGKSIKGFSHITGGGLIDNIPRLLDNKYKMLLDQEWEVPNVFKWIYNNSDMNIEDMLKTYNCGIGMVVILDRSLDIKQIMDAMSDNKLQFLGSIVRSTEHIINYEKIQKNFI